MRASYLYLMKSDIFPDGLIKVIASCASAPDIISAHKDVYGGDNITNPQYKTVQEEEKEVFPKDFDDDVVSDDVESDSESKESVCSVETANSESCSIDNTVSFEIFESITVWDIDLLKKSLCKISPAFAGFLSETQLATMRHIVCRINELSILVSAIDETTIELVDFIVPQEGVGAFDKHEVGAFDLSAVSESNFNAELVSLTRAFELTRFHEEETKFDAWPSYKQFLVFNKGYAYVTTVFQDVFPEFNLTVYDGFPCMALAEEMLWYQIDCQKDANDTTRLSTKTIIRKIQVFFDCCDSSFKVPESPNVPTSLLSTQSRFSVPVRRCFPSQISSMRISDMVPDEPQITVTGTAPAFQIPSSPCGNAFVTGVNLWNSNTREETDNKGPGAESVMIIKEFVAQMCHRARGHKIQSSKLFNAYKEFHKTRTGKNKPQPLSQAKFSILMKQISLFETHRYNSAIYWQDMKVSAQPSVTTTAQC